MPEATLTMKRMTVRGGSIWRRCYLRSNTPAWLKASSQFLTPHLYDQLSWRCNIQYRYGWFRHAVKVSMTPYIRVIEYTLMRPCRGVHPLLKWQHVERQGPGPHRTLKICTQEWANLRTCHVLEDRIAPRSQWALHCYHQCCVSFLLICPHFLSLC